LALSRFYRPFGVVNASDERYFPELAEPVTRSDGFAVRALER
jgi:hypothetical protein